MLFNLAQTTITRCVMTAEICVASASLMVRIDSLLVGKPTSLLMVRMCAVLAGQTSSLLLMGCMIAMLIGKAAALGIVTTSDMFVEMRWVTLKLIDSFVTTMKCAALLLEFTHVYGWEGRCCMVLGGVEVLLVNWHGGVDYVWLDGLLVNDWLDSLVHVVMYMLAGYFRNCL